LLGRLLVGNLVPTVLVLVGFGFLAHEVARRVLEDELGRRLALAAAGAAGMILPEQLAALEADASGNGGGEDPGSLTYANVRRKLELARTRFDVRRVALVSRELVGRGDTARRIADGSLAHELGADRLEMSRAATGAPSTSPLFEGHDGLPYKRAYAAIVAPSGEPAGSVVRQGVEPPRPVGAERFPEAVLGFVVVEASADYFIPLRVFRGRLVAGGVAALLAVLLFTTVLARRISRPVVDLATAAARIGRGDLEQPVLATTDDEIGFLAATLERMRTALKARDERLQMMLAGIAHEVRNPLGGLELYAGLLRDALAAEPERLEEVRRIEREVGYLKRVVNEFLDYARRPPLAPSTFRVGALLSEVAELARGSGGDAPGAPPVRVSVEAPAGLRVRGDEAQLRRALLNLAANAVVASASLHPAGGGKVTLRAAVAAPVPGRPPHARIEVDDDGPGVDPALRERIFTPFFTTRQKGTGLGLAFVREIVQDHGSEISVGAQGPSGGARFAFELPIDWPTVGARSEHDRRQKNQDNQDNQEDNQEDNQSRRDAP
jgi:signal transduction histidine kinase